MSTLAELRTRVRQYLDEDTAAFWTDVELNTWINQAYFYYFRFVGGAFEGYFSSVVMHDIVANDPLIALPADHWRTKLFERQFQTFSIPMQYFARNESANQTSNGAFGNFFVPTFRFQAGNIVMEPTPDLSITNGIRHEYIRQPVAMVADVDTPDAQYKVMWEEGIILRAVISAKQKEEAVVNAGADLSPLEKQLAGWEQLIKESAELRATSRRRTQPFGLDEASDYFYYS